jgi:hypothetical protein
MSGSLSLDRSVFGVGQGQFKDGDTVALEVKINVAVTAKRTPSGASNWRDNPPAKICS